MSETLNNKSAAKINPAEKNFAPLGVTKGFRALQKMNAIEPTPVQEKAIPPIRSGRDAVVMAPTGTGKTLAFLLPLFERMKADVPVIQTLIVTPTRELTVQIAKVARALGEEYGIKTLALYGGQDIERQKAKLGQHPQLIIGTPGRLLDHYRHGRLNLKTANKAVLDEADEMLKRGFAEDIEKLLALLAPDHQLLLFSATIPDALRALTRRFMNKPAEITIENEHITLDTIEQIVFRVNESEKLNCLSKYINEAQPYLMMVFCSMRQRAAKLAADLAARGYLVDEFHGDLTQAQRAYVLKRFRDAKLQIIVTTDIAARGLDIEGVTHVVNYDIPRTTIDYIHRIGRTGRAGKSGIAVTFVDDKQQEKLRRIEKGIKSRIKTEKLKRKTDSAKKAVLKKSALEKSEKTDKPAKTKGKLSDRKSTAKPLGKKLAVKTPKKKLTARPTKKKTSNKKN